MLEFAQRARREARGIVVNKVGDCATALLELGTTNGAASLGLPVGQIEKGAPADLISIDLDHPSMRGAQLPDAIADSLTFGSGNGPVDQVWVSGKPVFHRR